MHSLTHSLTMLAVALDISCSFGGVGELGFHLFGTLDDILYQSCGAIIVSTSPVSE